MRPRLGAVAVHRRHLPRAVPAVEREGVRAGVAHHDNVAAAEARRLHVPCEEVALEAQRPSHVHLAQLAVGASRLGKQRRTVVELNAPLVLRGVALPHANVRPEVDEDYLTCAVRERLGVFDTRSEPSRLGVERLTKLSDHAPERAARGPGKQRRDLRAQRLRVAMEARPPSLRVVVHRHAAAHVQHLDLGAPQAPVQIQSELYGGAHAGNEDLHAHAPAAHVHMDAIEPRVSPESLEDFRFLVDGHPELRVLCGDGEGGDLPRTDKRVDSQTDVRRAAGHTLADLGHNRELLPIVDIHMYTPS
mmetsp:Transcript_60218/g.168072  ORF Transcript_60218/g.168072 Transcript_60218/m.168072 type:complete len:304 (-) Transcript_60218:482-1393(-)